MRKAIFIFSILICALNANGLYKDFKTNILAINGDRATIKNSKDIVVGSSGIVIHKFGDNTSSIIARVDVINRSGDKATLKFHTYRALKQIALPIPGITPKVGDTVILNYLYDRALIVAPNYKTYKEITKRFKNITWVHPDIMGAYLAKQYRPNPDRKIFQTMCRQNVASLIFFALNNEAVFVDCNNFKVVKKLKSGKVRTAQLPFYTRVKGIDTSWLSFSSKKMDSYSNYYKRLINR
ncbi:MAG: plasminogen-binding N-terminal domain-containing protein [Sulfurospirillum sp.]